MGIEKSNKVDNILLDLLDDIDIKFLREKLGDFDQYKDLPVKEEQGDD